MCTFYLTHPVDMRISSISLRKAIAAGSTVLILSGAFTAVFSMTLESTLALHSECSDGKDNDNDGKIDYPQDNDCENLDDDFEGMGTTGNFITLTDGHETVAPGDAVVYIITLKQQRMDARNVNLDLHLPAQASVVSASDGGTINGGHVHWNNVSVYRSITRTLQVHVNIDPNAEPGQYMVARAITEGEQATDTTLLEKFVAQPNDIYNVSITDGKTTIQPGELLEYVIRVRNTSQRVGKTDVRVGIPYATYFIANSAGGKRDSYTVTWLNQTFNAGEEKTYKITVQVDPSIRNLGVIRARAFAGSRSDTDETSVKTGLPWNSITTSLSDGRTTARVGDLLTYTVKVTNKDKEIIGGVVAVSAAIPLYSEFVSATNGGVYDGTNVRWIVTQIAPNDTRSYQYTVRVRSDAPNGSELMASAVADGSNGVVSRDITVVSGGGKTTRDSDNRFFSKTSDRTEVLPGSRIRYTLTVRNIFNHTISDAKIVDRYDGKYLSLGDYENGSALIAKSDGKMTWKVPTLAPGETWSTSYVLTVERKVPSGLDLANVATISGTGLESVSLTELVRTSSADVIPGLPKTGAGLDVLMGLMTMIMAAGATVAQRKLSI